MNGVGTLKKEKLPPEISNNDDKNEPIQSHQPPAGTLIIIIPEKEMRFETLYIIKKLLGILRTLISSCTE